MRTTTSARGAWRLLRVQGAVSLEDGPALRDALLAALEDEADAVVCDLSEVVALDPACLAVFAAGQWSSPWPWPTVWLAGARGEVAGIVERVGGGRHVAVVPTVADAVAAVSSRPPLSRASLHAAATPVASRQARTFVANLCREWGLAHILDAVVLVTSELATNAAVHAGTDLEVRAEHGSGLLKIAVLDRSTQSAAALWSDRDGDLMRDSGRGLALVRALAVSVGTCMYRGGKVVWAALEATGPTPRPDGDGGQPRAAARAGVAAASRPVPPLGVDGSGTHVRR